MLKTTRTRRLAGIAAIALTGGVVLGACDGEEFDLCSSLRQAQSDISDDIWELEGQLEETDQDSREYDRLERRLQVLEGLYEAKGDAARLAGCEDVREIGGNPT